MVKLKGGGGSGGPPHTSGELTNVEIDLQVHKDETASKIGAVQASVAGIQDSVAALRAEILEELRLLRMEAKSTPPANGSSPQLSFGSIPAPTGSLPHGSSAVPVSSTLATSTSQKEGVGSISKPPFSSCPLNLGDHDVILGFASEVYSQMINIDDVTQSTSANTCAASVPNSGSDGDVNLLKKKGISAPQMQNHYYQHTNFGSQPFNYITGPLPSYSTMSNPLVLGHAPTTHYSEIDPFVMRYSGPYAHSIYHSASQPDLLQQHAIPLQQYQSVPYSSPNFHGVTDPSLPTMKQMRLEFNTFSGGDPVEWLNKAEQFFAFYQIPEDKKLAIATMHLCDKASDRWFMFKHEFPPTWNGLADLLMREFSGHNVIDYQAALAMMSQIGTVEQYKEQFTKLSRRAPGFSPQVLLSCFLGGLKSDIRADVKAQKPKTLYEACELARIYEERELLHRGQVKSHSGQKPLQSVSIGNQSRAPTYTDSSSQAISAVVTQPPCNTGTTVGNKRLSQAEYQERRAKNQCFFCDEQFRPGHNCQKGQLMVIEVMQEELELTDPVFNEVQEEQVQKEEDILVPEIQLRVMGGQDNSDTMQVKGLFNKKTVHVLIDTEASHNFIHPSLLKKLRTQVVDIKPLKVRLASGAVMQTKGQVSIEMQMQQYSFSANFYVLPVSGCEVVLGAAWLRTLGDITWNFETMKMQFYSNHTKYVLQGEREFTVGDQVYLKLQQYKQHSIHQGGFHKLSQRFYGPFEVLERIGKVAYKLKLPPTAKIHNVFHASVLKKKLGDNVAVKSQLPFIRDPSNPKWEPEAVLARRMVKKKGAASTQWLIHWMGTTPDEATWEDAETILMRFPHFDPDQMDTEVVVTELNLRTSSF